jgi:hypothetical protein
MKKLINKYVLIMLGMILVVGMGVVENVHENKMAEEAAIQQQKVVVEQGQQAKANTQWKLDHHNGEIPAYKD